MVTGAQWAWYMSHSFCVGSGYLTALTVPLVVPVKTTLPVRDTATALWATSSAGTSLRICKPRSLHVNSSVTKPPSIYPGNSRKRKFQTFREKIDLLEDTHTYTLGQINTGKIPLTLEKEKNVFVPAPQPKLNTWTLRRQKFRHVTNAQPTEEETGNVQEPLETSTNPDPKQAGGSLEPKPQRNQQCQKSLGRDAHFPNQRGKN